MARNRRRNTPPPAASAASSDDDQPVRKQFPLQVSQVPMDATFQEVRAAFDKVLKRLRDARPLKYTLELDAAEGHWKNGGGGVIYLDSEWDARHDILVKGQRVIFARVDESLTRALAIRPRFRIPDIPLAAKERKKEGLWQLRHEVRITAVQFGVVGRDQDSFSIEWEGDYNPDAPVGTSQRRFDDKPKQTAYLKFNEGRDDQNPRSVQIVIGGHSETNLYRITIPMIEIKTMVNAYDFGQPYIILELLNPPSFEMRLQHAPSTGDARADREKSWQRISHLDAAHERVVPFTSRALRLVLTRDETHLENFIQMSKWSLLPRLRQSRHSHISSGLELFSRHRLDRIDAMVKKLPWIVGFQCEALLRNCLLVPTELLALEDEISRLNRIDTKFAAEVLKLYIKLVPHISQRGESFDECLDRAERDTRKRGLDIELLPPRLDTFQCRHVRVTPTSFQLDGPYLEQSNRVIRFFGPEYNEYFLRVMFSDEGGSRFRIEFEVDNHEFVRERVGGILKKGLTVAGRRFSFLAYSSSGLRQHSVWFVTPFKHPKWKGFVTADAIRKSLGNFSEELLKWPARYGARISQAFSATYPSVEVEPDEIEEIPDIETDEIFNDGDGNAKPKCFTDGVGTISPQLADEIWEKLCEIRLKGRIAPRAYQIRLGGCKGVVSVDHRLQGRRICIRPSMKKFNAPNSRGIEISEAFDTPIPFHLNRPLIMLLDNLGVTTAPFLKYLDIALETIHKMLNTPNRSAALMQEHGLGKSYKIPLFLTRLERYGLTALHEHDPFIRKLLIYAKYHVKRELRYHARIPVPDCWTLVGVADVHNVLQPGEVFGQLIIVRVHQAVQIHEAFSLACIRRVGEEPIWLEGRVSVSRSPTVHPGDVQCVNAIGKPEPGSPYDIEDLANCLVFSVKGSRPLSTCLGGGDLDGDKYDIITVPELQPENNQRAAAYTAPPTYKLDRKCTMDDIADFVVDFMNNDCVGLIATNHLRLADERPEGVRDAACMKLADLHSVAIDFLKNGEGIRDLDNLPKPTRKPDWACSESEDPDDGYHYPSLRVLGYLFRHVELGSNPVEEPPLLNNDFRQDDEVWKALSSRVLPLIKPFQKQVDETEFEELFYRYIYDLKYQCVAHNLQQSPSGRLTEEEVTLGSILGRTTSPTESRKRSNLMERLEQQATENVRNVEAGILGDPDSPLELKLARAWIAYKMAYGMWRDEHMMGSRSFAFLALNIILDILEQIGHNDEREVGEAQQN
ncbi:hypothetical protein FRB99_000672 [Tulasnella sp. 403]|nr:hypothetical protein FRB99_000672 [Tulasnella sp. 403]